MHTGELDHNLPSNHGASNPPSPPLDRGETKDTNGTQFAQLCKCVLLSVPLTLGGTVIPSLIFGERFFFLSLAVSFVICPLWAAFQIQSRENPPPKHRLVRGFGLAFLTGCANFLLACGALMIYCVFFFAS